MEDIFLLIKEEVDFHTIYGVYDDILKAEEDYFNLLKYQNICVEELHIYALKKNYYYNNEDFVEIY